MLLLLRAPLWFQCLYAEAAAFHLLLRPVFESVLQRFERSAESVALVQLCHTKTTSQLSRKSPRRKRPHAEELPSDWMRCFWDPST